MDELLPVLFDRVYLILGQPANGTDDVLVQAELRKAYLTFLTTIFQAGLHQILLSPSKCCPLRIRGLTDVPISSSQQATLRNVH